MSYTWEKFHGAIHSLAGSGTQRERLVAAYTYNLIRLSPEDLPNEIQEDFRKLQERITKFEAQDKEGSVQATVNKIDDSEVKKIIDKIISMHDTVTRHQEPF